MTYRYLGDKLSAYRGRTWKVHSGKERLYAGIVRRPEARSNWKAITETERLIQQTNHDYR